MDVHGYVWDLKDFASSLPAKSSTEFPPQMAKDSISNIQCDSDLTKIMTNIEMELDMEICIFSTPWPVTNNLDCGRDSLRVFMCRKPFKLYEKVIKLKKCRLRGFQFFVHRYI